MDSILDWQEIYDEENISDNIKRKVINYQNKTFQEENGAINLKIDIRPFVLKNKMIPREIKYTSTNRSFTNGASIPSTNILKTQSHFPKNNLIN